MTRMLAYFLLLSSLAMPLHGAEKNRPARLALPADGQYEPGPLTPRPGTSHPPSPMTARARRHRPSLNTSSGKLVTPAPEAHNSDSASEPKETRIAWPAATTSCSSSDHATPGHTDHNSACFLNSVACAAGSGCCAILVYVAYVGIPALINDLAESGSSDLG